MLLTPPLLQIGFVLGATDTPLIDPNAALFLVKILFVAVGILYLVFSLIATRQINLMRRTLITDFGPLVQVLGLVQLAIAVILLLVFLIL